jgi:hypothetical protein
MPEENTPPSDEELAHLIDKKLAGRLIAGWLDSDGKHQYLEPGSTEERGARSAMARVLRDIAVRSSEPGDLHFLFAVARLFDPETIAKITRDMTFHFRQEGGGGPTTFLRDHYMGLEMLRMVRDERKTATAAVKKMMEKHGLEERQVWKIWASHGKPRMPKKPRKQKLHPAR